MFSYIRVPAAEEGIFGEGQRTRPFVTGEDKLSSLWWLGILPWIQDGFEGDSSEGDGGVIIAVKECFEVETLVISKLSGRAIVGTVGDE